jgi:hypothetical protein
MINDLDETIRRLILTRGFFENDSVAVSFDQPTGDWAAGLTRPTVNCYLYDIREDLGLRSAEWLVEKNAQGQANKRLAPLRYDLSYLITVWTQNQVEDEHAILWRVLGALAGADPLPLELAQGELGLQPYPIRTQAAQPSMAVQNMPDLWGVMQNQLRPSIDFVVTIAMARPISFEAPLVLSRRMAIRDRQVAGREGDEVYQIAGLVVRRKDGAPVPGASVTLLDSGRSAVTDRFGRFSFIRLAAGSYQAQVTAKGQSAQHTLAVPAQGHDAAYYDLEL